MQSSTAMAVHMPVRPKRGTSSSALPTRTSQILPRFKRLGTSVSPAPRSAPAATIDAPNKGSARSSMRSTLAARVCTSGTGVRRPKTMGQMSIMTAPVQVMRNAPRPMQILPQRLAFSMTPAPTERPTSAAAAFAMP